jgi:two-component system response regulator FixJ
MRTVFVIDDDSLMREVLSRLFEKSDYRVRAFPSPHHALPLIDAGYPDAIVSDVQMPGMTGVELARCVRERGIRVPLVLVTGAPGADIDTQARQLDVSQVFEKPMKDASQLVGAVDRAISKRESEERTAGLDTLRLSFLTGLAHELRTPLTAIKLVLENLFASRQADLLSPEGKLLAIGQRNLDRIIRLVEGQLDLLQITLGDVSVARRLVFVRDLIERAASETQPSVRKKVVIDRAEGEEPLYLFTDPDRLRAVVRFLLEGALRDDSAPVTIGCRAVGGSDAIELRFDNIRVPASPCEIQASAPYAGPIPGSEASAGAFPHRSGGDPFETRAFHRIVSSLFGEILGESSEQSGTTLLRFPVRPRFDAREDFVVPLTSLREAAMLSGRTVSVVKCVVGDHRRNGSCFSRQEREFFQRCASALSEGDALIRSRPEGTYLLVLVERSADEMNHIVEFLRAPETQDAEQTDGKALVETTVLRGFPTEGHDDVLADVEMVP